MSDSEEEKKSGPQYKVSEKVSMDKLLAQDANDASLQKYKASLGLTSNIYAPKDDPRRCVILELRVITESRPGGDIVYTLGTPESIKKLKGSTITIKEGANYRIKVTFRVQHEIVSGLKYVLIVSRHGIKVDKQEEMLGSFAPQEKPYEVTFPRQGWEEAPSGMLARGTYHAKAQFIDDDKQCHLEYEYNLAIRKTWEDKD